MAALIPVFSGIGSAISGGIGSIGSLLSTVGTIASTFSSFMGKDSPDVPMPGAVNVGTAAPLPEVTQPATLLTDNEQQTMAANEKKRRALAQSRVNSNSNTLADTSTPATTAKATLLGQ